MGRNNPVFFRTAIFRSNRSMDDEPKPAISPTAALPHPAERRRDIEYCRDERLGDFTHLHEKFMHAGSANRWFHRRATADGVPFLLTGYGTEPIDAQLSLWKAVEPHLTEMVIAALGSVPAPPIPSPEIDPSAFSLGEVRLMPDSTVQLFLDHPVSHQISCWPQIIFSGRQIIETCWTV